MGHKIQDVPNRGNWMWEGGREDVGALHSAQFFCKSKTTLKSVRTVLGTQQVLNKWWLLAGCEAGHTLMTEDSVTQCSPFALCPEGKSAFAQRQSYVWTREREEHGMQVCRKALQGVVVSSAYIYSFWETLILFCVPFLVELYIIRRIKNCVYPHAHGERWGSG